MYLSFEQIAAATVKTAADLTIPAEATHAEVCASANDIMYTMDNATNPTTTMGMILSVFSGIDTFNIEDIKRIRFIQAASGAKLNIHYFAGRNI